MSFLDKLFGTFSDKELTRIQPLADKVLALEPEMQQLTDDELRGKTAQFKERLAKGETLDDLLPEAFAVCREADWRVIGLKPYPVQVIGGIVLHRACIAEMQTGEGKTLVATMPVYLNALTGRGVHVVTVNDYLARRDSEWMGKVYRFLGLSVGLVVHSVEPAERKKAYAADVTYGTNNEFGFDYLRDNMVVYKQNMVQRGHAYAIVDEVDSILIDEARTPLIISGKGEDSSAMYKRADDFAKTLKKSVIVELDDKVEAEEQVDGDYVVDEKRKTATLTESGVQKAEAYFGVENLADADPDSPLINNEYDRTVLGSSLPHFNYGGNISLAWKGIDFSLDFQGVGKRNSYLSTAMVQPLRSQWYNIPEIIVGNSWSRKNTIEQNMKARYPRYSWNSNDSNYAYSDFWLFDGSYFRVKNITLGYSLPEKWMKKVWIKNLSFAATLTDFFTISHFPKGWDPEGGVTSYPITKSVIFSASITF